MAFVYAGDPEVDTQEGSIEYKGNIGPVPTPENAQAQASKYDFVLGDKSPGVESAVASLQASEKEYLDNLVRQQKALDFIDTKRAMVNDLISTQQGPVSQDEVDFIMGMTELDAEEVSKTDFPMETEYAKKFLRTAMERDERATYFTTEKWAPEEVNQIMDGFESHAQKLQIVDSLSKEMESRMSGQSTFNWLADWTENLLDPTAPFNTNDIATDSDKEIGSGGNLRDQVDYLLALPPAEFEGAVKTAVETLAENNPLDAMRLLNAMKRYSMTDVYLDNIFGVIGLGEIGAGAFKLGKLSRGVEAANKVAAEEALKAARPGFKPDALKEGLKAAVRESVEEGPADIARTAKRMGSFKTSAVVNAVKKYGARLAPNLQKIEGGQAVLNQLPSIMNPGSFFKKTLGNRSDTALEAMMRKAEEGEGIITKMLTEVDTPGSSIERLTRYAEELWDTKIKGRLGPIQNAILDVDVGRQQTWELANEPVSNTYGVSVAIGRRDGTLFATGEQAAATLSKLKALGIADRGTVQPHGTGYYLDLNYAIPEDPEALVHIKIPEIEKYNTGWFNGVFGLVGSARMALPQGNIRNRLTAMHPVRKFAELYTDLSRPIADLSKTEFAEMEQVWKYNRDVIREINGKEVRGMWFENAADLEAWFFDKFGYLPTDKQLDAYRAYRQLNDMDFIVRSASWYKDKLRANISNYEAELTVEAQVPTPDGGTEVGTASRKFTFEGKEVDPSEITFSPEKPIKIAVESGNGTVRVLDSRNPEHLVELKALGERGDMRLVQVADSNLKIPGHEKGVGIGFVYAPGFTKAPITMIDKYRPGGHVVQRYGHYIKQGIIETDEYGDNLVGDNSIAGAATRAEAAKIAKLWNEARLMLVRNVDDETLGDFVHRNLDMSVDEFRRIFQDQVDPATGKVLRKGLNPDLEIVATDSGQRTSDVWNYGDKVRDITKSEYNLLQEMNRKFAGERDNLNLWTYDEEGDLITLNRDGNLFDPIETLRQAGKNVMDLRFKKEYALSSADSWVEQFGHLLEGTDNIRNPMRTIYNPTFKPNANPEQLRAAQNGRRQILALLGQRNDQETFFDSIKHKMRDLAYEKGGAKGLKIVDDWAIPIAQDPFAVARTIAFHVKLGLFSWPQLLVQAQGTTMVAALSKEGGKAAAVVPMIRSARVAMQHLDHWAGMASRFGWSTDEFKEMMTALDNSGFMDIKNSHGFLDDLGTPDLFTSKAGKVIDAGAVFFNEGEQMVRAMGYAAAYREWKVASKGAKLDKAARAAILDRADTLTMNMSAANSSIWQRGILGVPSQFMSYQARVTEMYLGKRLTNAEKGRLFAMQAAMYGLPTAVGGAVGVWPVYESIREKLVEKGIDYNENVMTQLLTQGGIATALSAMGLEADVAQRFGTGGISVLKDAMDDPSKIPSLLVGPSGNVLGDLVASGSSALAGMLAVAKGDKSLYNFTAEDVLAAAQNISSVNNALKGWIALNTEKWMTKNGSYVDQVSTMEAIYMTATGDQMDRIADLYAKIDVLKDRSDKIKEVSKEVAKLYERGAMEDDRAIREEYMRRAWALGQAAGMDAEEIMAAQIQGLKNLGTSQLESVERRYQEDIINRLGNPQ